jgi:hypothetical protein
MVKRKKAVDGRTDNTIVKRKRGCRSKDRQYNGQKKKAKKQTMDKIIHRTPYIE